MSRDAQACVSTVSFRLQLTPGRDLDSVVTDLGAIDGILKVEAAEMTPPG
jgi:hypothetical protein